MPVTRRELGELLDRLLPARRQGSESDLLQPRFVALAAWLGCAIGLLYTGLVASALPNTAVATFAYAVFAAGIGVALKLGLPVALSFWSMQVGTGVFIAAVATVEPGPLDMTLPCWLAILPLTATLFDGLRGALVAFGLAAVATAVTLVGNTLPEGSHLAAVARVTSLHLAVTTVALVFQRLRERALHEAETALAARTFFLASMSHEIRTPLNGIIGFTDLLLANERTADERAALETMQRSGAQLVEIINDIVDFSRLDAGRLKIAPAPTDIRAVTRDARRIVAAAAPRYEVSLVEVVDEAVGRWLELDPTRVHQVLVNLLGNALKFTPVGRVDLELSVDGSPPDTLVIQVRDTGIGIAPADQARLFQPFWQAAPRAMTGGAGGAGEERAVRGRGSGLGLAITRQLVELMGGSLVLVSELGRGTQVTVRLPYRPVAAPAVAPGAVPAGASAPAPNPSPPSRSVSRVPALAAGDAPLTRVLVVDDNAVNVHVTAAMLTRAGYATSVARSGREAVELVASGSPFGAVLMDCHMPDLDGVEATRRIRALGGAAGRTPIIALTASVLPEEVARCREAGMDGWLGKPVAYQALIASVDAAVQVPATRR